MGFESVFARAVQYLRFRFVLARAHSIRVSPVVPPEINTVQSYLCLDPLTHRKSVDPGDRRMTWYHTRKDAFTRDSMSTLGTGVRPFCTSSWSTLGWIPGGYAHAFARYRTYCTRETIHR